MRDIPSFPHVNTACTIFNIQLFIFFWRELTVSADRLAKSPCPLSQFCLRTSVSRLTYVKNNSLVGTGFYCLMVCMVSVSPYFLHSLPPSLPSLPPSPRLSPLSCSLTVPPVSPSLSPLLFSHCAPPAY